VVAALRGATGTPEYAERDRLPQPAQALSMLRPWVEADGESSFVGATPPAASVTALQGSLLGESGAGFGGGDFAALDSGAARLAEPPRRQEVGDENLYWQLHNAYILVQIKGGLVLVDQHAAHERVLFDRSVEALEGRSAGVQRLLFPITLELAVRQYAAFEEASALLDRLGFQVQPFGGRSVLVEGIPAEMHNWDEGAVLLGMLDDLAENRETKRLPLRDKVLATFACRGAIMIGKKLSQPEMRALMDQLFATTRPYTCPHGRPTLFRIGLDDLGRKFQRT
jgi:DNA mismatch repair protein MutL